MADVIRSGVAIADSITTSIQGDVIHEAWIGIKDKKGSAKFAAPVSRRALIEKSQTIITNEKGETVKRTAKVTFLRVVEPNGAEGRSEPVDERDRITLPDGLTGPILTVKGGVLDPATGRPYLVEVQLG